MECGVIRRFGRQHLLSARVKTKSAIQRATTRREHLGEPLAPVPQPHRIDVGVADHIDGDVFFAHAFLLDNTKLGGQSDFTFQI